MPISTTSVDLANLLLGLAWLGELDRKQIQRLWFTDKSVSTVEKTLARLRSDALITRRAWSIRDPERGVTASQLARWSLAPAGHALIKTSDQYPAKPVQVRQQRLIAHDARTTETIVRLIEAARPSKLSGIYIAHELRLHPQERRPVCDALVVMQFGAFDHPNLVPWSSDPAIDDEGKFRLAIEADNDTEPLAVIKAKAYAYRRLAEDREWRNWWTRQHGPLPFPLWVAPSEVRADAIHEQWKRAWPDGYWLFTTDTALQEGVVQQWSRQMLRTTAITFRQFQPALPAPPVQRPVLPAQQANREQASVSGGAAQLPATTAPMPAPPQTNPTSPATPSSVVVSTVEPGKGSNTSPTTTYPARNSVQSSDEAVEHELAEVRRLYAAFPRPNPYGHMVRAMVKIVSAFTSLLSSLLKGAWSSLKQRALLGPAVMVLTVTIVAVLLWQPVTVAVPTILAALSKFDAPDQPNLPIFQGPSMEVVPQPVPSTVVPTPTPRGCAQVRVIAQRVNLRADPGLHSAVVRRLEEGEVLDVLNCMPAAKDDHQWLRVIGASDVTPGWVAVEFVK